MNFDFLIAYETKTMPLRFYKNSFMFRNNVFLFCISNFCMFRCHDTRMLYNLISLPLCCCLQLLYHHHAIEIKIL